MSAPSTARPNAGLVPNAWLQRWPARARPAARLFCFPHAGVGPQVFYRWPAGLPAWLEICAAQLPGRANRLHEPPISNLQVITEHLLDAIAPQLDLPFAFFGHSMGAVLAFEVVRAMALRCLPMPSHLIVSGRRAPHMADIAPRMHSLSDPEFVAEINRRYGGIPQEILENQDILTLLLPALRADITALETYRPPPGAPLSCAVLALGGADDPLIPRAHLEAWRHATTGGFQIRTFPGGHFYLDPQRDELLAELSAKLATMLDTVRGRERQDDQLA